MNIKANILNKILAQFNSILKEYSTIKWDLFWDITFFILVNCSKENKHTIILVAAEETFEKIQHILFERFFSNIRIDVYFLLGKIDLIQKPATCLLRKHWKQSE